MHKYFKGAFDSRWGNHEIFRCIRVLDYSDRRKILAITFIQISLGLLDLLGVIAIGLLGALSVTGIQNRLPGNRVSSALDLLHISEISFQAQAIVLGGLAVVLLVGRTLLSIFFTRRILFFLSRKGADMSANLIRRLLSSPLLFIQSRTTQETLYAVTSGVALVTLQVLATGVVLITDLSLLIIMTISLFVVDPLTALLVLVIFSFIGFSLYQFMHVRAGKLGELNSRISISSNEKIVEVLNAYREAVVRNRRDFYSKEIAKLRYALANVSAETAFMPFVSKYVVEGMVVVGGLIVGAVQFVLNDASHAVATLAIFLAAGTRIAPSVLRVQQSAIQIRGSLGAATPTLNLIDALGTSPLEENIDDGLDTIHEGFTSEIHLRNVTMTYPTRESPAVKNFDLSIPAGAFVAFVGPSGAGKTTLVDILLGVIQPNEGLVTISGEAPLRAFINWPGAVSYVPQDVVIVSGTIRENVALGYPENFATDAQVISALQIANLDKFIENATEGLETQVGERGTNLSGGQRQRLGIARAMFTSPQVLVLDEATSSLDAETEAGISAAINELKGKVTVIMIAHRLSTIRNADFVVYLKDGCTLAIGTFDEVRKVVPDFDRQAILMGL